MRGSRTVPPSKSGTLRTRSTNTASRRMFALAEDRGTTQLAEPSDNQGAVTREQGIGPHRHGMRPLQCRGLGAARNASLL